MLHLFHVALLGGNMVLSSYAKGWVRLPTSGPDNFNSSDPSANLYYVNNILLGTPPAPLYIHLDISSPSFTVNSESCMFCGDGNFFDSSLSTTFVSLNETVESKLADAFGLTNTLRISSGQDIFSFGGIRGSPSRPSALKLVDWIQGQFDGSATRGTPLVEIISNNNIPLSKAGFYVDIVNATLRASHPLTELYEQGLLQNPVVGFSLKTVGNESSITIGALDQEDYIGELNWVEAEIPQPDWELPTVIAIDAFGGISEGEVNGKIILYLNTSKHIIHVMTSFVSLELIGVFSAIMLPWKTHIDFPNLFVEPLTTHTIFHTSAVGEDMSECGFFQAPGATNSTSDTYFQKVWYPLRDVLPVVINGVTYNVDRDKNLALLQSSRDPSLCQSGLLFYNSTTSSVQGSLGLPFFRSAYVAYRFPTADCPKAFYGFAFQKGSNVSASVIAQKPNSTPTSSAQCLQFSTPTETPALNIPPTLQASIGYNGKYKVFGKENAPEVQLINAGELMAMDWPN
ncbi:hypothetical protein M422DRAFT_260590 [Sphaerobolus stellatus SS14]|uniref:Peptidase A1 domain-containing protein n=1 Tax=Sphaerobolus stellatus (strain SS14) TaxID=990650 RepID=A0A0C9UQJ7_SPHS4|nr:hypothetical protein M422DRAFT_260590 [Sphaerobolus stellatus SS14]